LPKPRVFIGSAREAEDLVAELAIELDPKFQPLPWYEAFPIDSTFTLERLVEVTAEVEFAIFLLGGEDSRVRRGEPGRVPRDNVVLEFGLFLGVLGPGRVFVLRYAESSAPTDLDGLIVTSLEGSPSAQRARIKKFVAELESVVDRLPPRSLPLTSLEDGKLGVKETIRAEHLKLLENARKLATTDEVEYLEFDSNPACVRTYIEALQYVQRRFWTTTFLSSGFWIHRDSRIIDANLKMLRRLGNKAPKSIRRLFIVERSPDEEIEFTWRRLVHLRQQSRDQEALELSQQLSQLQKRLLTLLEEGCEIKIVQDHAKLSKQLDELIPFNRQDSEIAVYDDFRVDIFSGGRFGRIDDVKIYSASNHSFDAIKSAAEEYFELLWTDSKAQDARVFVHKLEQVKTLAAKHISYVTPNWLARFEYNLGARDSELKVVELKRLTEELRSLGRWGKIRRYLDIGTCTARYPIAFREAVTPKGSILGLDIDEDSVAFSRGKVEAVQDDRIRIEEGDFLSPTLKLGGHFDLITCMLGTLSHFGGWENGLRAALQRMRAEVSPTGLVVLSNWSAKAVGKWDFLEIYNPSDRQRLALDTPELTPLGQYLTEVGLELVRDTIQPDQRIDLLICRPR
jgi:SAM-dependent methyltransferase